MILNERIDFAGVISVKHCNPNGDPIIANRPRINMEGFGEISDVCIKRKIRNSLMYMGQEILIVPEVNTMDIIKDSGLDKLKDKAELLTAACEKWIDVRMFGQVFPFKELAGEGVSTSVRGPVSIQSAVSLDIVDIVDQQITKCANIDEKDKKNGKGRSTMGMKSYVERGAYAFYGSIYPQMAQKSQFSQEDFELFKEAMLAIFDNDASAARPAGSMTLTEAYFWHHGVPNGIYNPARVHRSLKLEPIEEFPFFKSSLTHLEGLEVEKFEQ